MNRARHGQAILLTDQRDGSEIIERLNNGGLAKGDPHPGLVGDRFKARQVGPGTVR